MTGEKLLNVGIINASTDDKTWCSSKAFEDPYNCRQYLAVDKIEGMLNRECKGKESCTLGNWDTDLYRKNLPKKSSTEFNECFASGSQIFIQVACQLEDEEIANRQFQGFYIGGIVLIAAIYVIAFINYIA